MPQQLSHDFPMLGGSMAPTGVPVAHGKGSVQSIAPPQSGLGADLFERASNLPIPAMRNAAAVARLTNWLVQAGGRLGSLEAQAWYRGEDSPLATMYRSAQKFHQDAMRKVEYDRILQRMGADRELRRRFVWGGKDDEFPIHIGPNGEEF
jgi:hypothetical protein